MFRILVDKYVRKQTFGIPRLRDIITVGLRQVKLW
jgi:hypothetical protein